MNFQKNIRSFNPTTFKVLDAEEQLTPPISGIEGSCYRLELHPSEMWRKPNFLDNPFVIKLEKGQVFLHKSDYHKSSVTKELEFLRQGSMRLLCPQIGFKVEALYQPVLLIIAPLIF